MGVLNALFENFHWVLYVCGVLTATMFLQAISPVAVMERTYGSAPTDPNGLMLARHWGLMVGLSGLLLIGAGMFPEIRSAVLWFAIIGKGGYAYMILRRFEELQGKPAIMNAMVDVIMILLFIAYLAGT